MTTIRIVEYDPSWPQQYEAERARIADLLDDLVQDAHHIGSTSVPGLAAKPKIDIDVVATSLQALLLAVKMVAALPDYNAHGDFYGDGKWLFTACRGAYGIRLYLCAPGNATHAARLLFRDWLRSHPGDAARYEALKRSLADRSGSDWDAYTGGKSDFVREIVDKARGQGAPP